jgi:hypothetical protein
MSPEIGAPGSESDDEALIAAGIHPGSRQFEQRIRERMRLLDRDETQYLSTIREIIREDSRGAGE